MRVYARKGREVLLQQVVGTHHEILLLVTVDDVVKGHEEAERIIEECLVRYNNEIAPKIIAERKARGY